MFVPATSARRGGGSWHDRHVQRILIATDRGEARVGLAHAKSARGALVLGHGAGGAIDAPDLAAAAAAALQAGFDVASSPTVWPAVAPPLPPPISTRPG